MYGHFCDNLNLGGIWLRSLKIAIEIGECSTGTVLVLVLLVLLVQLYLASTRYRAYYYMYYCTTVSCMDHTIDQIVFHVE